MRASSSTPETRRRELLLSKSSSIDGKIRLALEEAKLVVRKSIEDDHQQYLLNRDRVATTSPINRRTTMSDADKAADEHVHQTSMSWNRTESSDRMQLCSSSSSTYHVRLASDDDDNEKDSAHFITCLNIEPQWTLPSAYHRSRTSSLPSSTIIVDLSRTTSNNNHRSSSLIHLNAWQDHPQKVIHLFDRQYHCQPITPLNNQRFLLANSKQIDIYDMSTDTCMEKLCFQSSTMNYIGLCYNSCQSELLVASTSNLYVYNLLQRTIRYQIQLPGVPFNLDTNHCIRYLACNSTSIYHGYFSFTSTSTSTVLSRLSQFKLKHMNDLEFVDGTLHGLHALEQYVGLVIRYGRYSSKQNENYTLYIYDSSLDRLYYELDLHDIGYISCLTGYERTLDWILCDCKQQRLIFVNQESIEYVQYNEPIHQCVMFETSNYFAVWLTDRIQFYTID
jgi:hypothetical protein